MVLVCYGNVASTSWEVDLGMWSTVKSLHATADKALATDEVLRGSRGAMRVRS